ncbi:hypothetical protein RRG08_004566 [Elysia crispata]|uniref:Uncharacterized protein n=1 Tax=Elysia crispata TaxID=231223 RepID=A0AAE1E087_9GAST|nr:hypothetical protein RRG08_004566 [Elysia crispata]
MVAWCIIIQPEAGKKRGQFRHSLVFHNVSCKESAQRDNVKRLCLSNLVRFRDYYKTIQAITIAVFRDLDKAVKNAAVCLRFIQ